MTASTSIPSGWTSRVVLLSVLLYLFTVPHTLEDFAYGEPARAGMPTSVVALVVSLMFAFQALALYWLGRKLRRSLYIHMGMGLFWAIAAGAAQLPVILSGGPYRAGALSVLHVVGMIAVGLLLCIASAFALARGSGAAPGA